MAQRPSLPVLALTASASLSGRKAIATSLGIRQPIYICGDLNRQNIYYEVQRRKGDVELDFDQFAEDLKRLRGHMPHTVIYCRRLLDCGLIFEFLQIKLGAQQYWPDVAPRIISNRLFHQFHRPLPCSDKELVLKLFMDPSSACRVVISAVALGMGLDCPEVRHVIHYGVPSTVEAYYQESGRCGRDGLAATATIMFNGHDIKQEPHPLVSIDMRRFCLSDTCLRKCLLQHFGQLDRCDALNGRCCSVCQTV